MKPLHIAITGQSKHRFSQIAPSLMNQKFSPLIQRVSPPPHTLIMLSEKVTDESDLSAITRFLERKGIRSTDIRFKYPAPKGVDFIFKALSSGLAESGLAFGGDVAERDNGLQRYFIRTNPFRLIEAHKKHIVVGPKGSGKSAILRELATDDDQSLLITPEHYANEVLETITTNANSTELGAYISTWKYTILVEIFKKLVHNAKGDSKTLGVARD